jgi:hypothetical protein
MMMRRARRRDEKDSYAMRADAAVLRSHCGLLTRAGQEIWVAHDIGVENGRPLSRWCSSSAKTRTHPAKLQRSRGPARGQPRGHGPQPRGHRRRGRLGLTAEPSGGRPSLQNLTLRSCSQAYVHASTPPATGIRQAPAAHRLARTRAPASTAGSEQHTPGTARLSLTWSRHRPRPAGQTSAPTWSRHRPHLLRKFRASARNRLPLVRTGNVNNECGPASAHTRP